MKAEIGAGANNTELRANANMAFAKRAGLAPPATVHLRLKGEDTALNHIHSFMATALTMT